MDFSTLNCMPSVVARYQGIMPPTCKGGKGCAACWAKYRAHQQDIKDKMREEMANGEP